MPPLPAQNRSFSTREWLLLIGASLAYFFIYHWPLLTDPFHFQEDVVQHYLWLNTIRFDAEWADSFYPRTSGAIQPFGYYALLRALVVFFDPLTISRWLPLPLTVLTVVYGTALFRRVFPLALALAGGLLITHYNLSESLGGLARAFCVPLLTAFAYYLVRGDKPRPLAIMLLLCALFYPPTLLVNAGILVLWTGYRLLDNLKTKGKDWRRFLSPSGPVEWSFWLPVIGGGIVAVSIAWLHSHRIAIHPDLNGFLTDPEMRWLPEFGGEGRVAFSNLRDAPPGNILRYFVRTYFTFGYHVHFAYAGFLLAFGLAVTFWKRLARPAIWLMAFAASTCFLYVLARELMPMLFLPDRYVNYPWRLLAGGILTFLAGGLYYCWPRKFVAGILTVALLAWGYIYRPPENVRYADVRPQNPTFEAVRTTPPNAMIAAMPQVADMIPLFTNRSVFISSELSHALYFRAYYNYITPRFEAEWRGFAAPADSLDQVLGFMEEWNIDYLLTDREQLGDMRFPTFAPYEERFSKHVAGREAGDLALLTIPESTGVLVEGRYQLLSRAEIENLLREQSQGKEEKFSGEN